MGDSQVTIVITPREQFSKVRRSLESIFECTDASVPLVYVDANSPPAAARYIREQAARRGFTLLRTGRYLCSNEARNLALPYVRTKYVAFVDNDVVVTQGWLNALVACAEETGAWAVGPLYLIDDPAKQLIHMAGGELAIVEEHGVRRLHEQHRFSNVPVVQVREQLVRERTGIVEFHCMLVRKDVFERTGPLDEQLLSFLDHVDFCLAIVSAGGSVYIEPASIVTHLAPPPYAWYDVPYFLLRWSDAWMETSVRRFVEKHRLAASDPQIQGHRRFRNGHRMRLFRAVREKLLPVLRDRGVTAIQAFLTAVILNGAIERTLVAALERRRRAAR